MLTPRLPARNGSRPFEIQATANHVRAWSDVRLPFEPKGASRDFRDALRAACRGLERTGVLYASYSSPDLSTCDVENVTLYNLGYAPFRGLGHRRVVVERRLELGPPDADGRLRRHYVEYASEADAKWHAWKPRTTLVHWTDVNLSLSSTTTASSVWAALKRGTVRALGRCDGTEPLGVLVRITGFRDADLVPLVKALLDGVVAAGHSYEGPNSAEVCARLAAAVAETPDRVGTWLSNAGHAALEPRELLHLRAGKLQWNPADDRVVAFSVERTDSSREDLTAAIFAMEPGTTELGSDLV